MMKMQSFVKSVEKVFSSGRIKQELFRAEKFICLK